MNVQSPVFNLDVNKIIFNKQVEGTTLVTLPDK